MSSERDNESRPSPTTPEAIGSAYAASSSESGGLYNEDGATLGTPDGVPISDEADDEPQGEEPDIPDDIRSQG